MDMRTVNPGAGWKWLVFGINLGRGNPRAIFGGAALLVLALLAVAIVLSIAAAAVTASMGGTGGMVASFVISAPILVVMAAMMVGYLRIIDAVEHGRPASATGVFAGFGDRQAWLHATGLLLVLGVIQNLLTWGLVAWVAPEVMSWYATTLTMGPGEAPPEALELPAGMGRAAAIVSVIALLAFAVQAVGLGQVALRGRGAMAALGDGLRGAVRNVLPLVVMLLLAFVALIVFMIVLGVIGMVVAALVGVAGGAGAVIAAIIGIPLYLLAMLALFVVMMGVMYAVWRDIAGAGAPPVDSDHAVVA